MARTLSVDVSCDFCGFRSLFPDPTLYARAGRPGEQVDLCLRCTEGPFPTGSAMASGEHELVFEDNGWTCDCGATFRDEGRMTLDVSPFYVSAKVRRAVPSLVAATALHHFQDSWRRSAC